MLTEDFSSLTARRNAGSLLGLKHKTTRSIKLQNRFSVHYNGYSFHGAWPKYEKFRKRIQATQRDAKLEYGRKLARHAKAKIKTRYSFMQYKRP